MKVMELSFAAPVYPIESLAKYLEGERLISGYECVTDNCLKVTLSAELKTHYGELAGDVLRKVADAFMSVPSTC